MNETVIAAWGDASDVMTKLNGSWSLDRLIEGQGTMQGMASFTPLNEGSLAYREQGTLKPSNGTALRAERDYIFSQRIRGFQVFFKEDPPRPFHEVSLSESAAGELSGSAGHLCNFDHYQSTYTFMGDGRFVVRHVVSGPRKHYTMTTAYARLA